MSGFERTPENPGLNLTGEMYVVYAKVDPPVDGDEVMAWVTHADSVDEAEDRFRWQMSRSEHEVVAGPKTVLAAEDDFDESTDPFDE